MRQINRTVLLCITGALWLALVFMVFFANGSGGFFNKSYSLKDAAHWGSKRILTAPLQSRLTAVKTDDLEELNETKFMLTYEVNREKSIQTVNSRHSIILKGTNYTYPFVMGYNILSGGFFTKEAQDQQSKVAVLNEWAAFEIFGGTSLIGTEIPIGGFPYSIVGVIDDGDRDNKNVYVPLAHLNEQPEAFIGVINENSGVSAAYIQNEFKQIGVTDDHYDFINLDILSRGIREKTFVSIELAAAAFLVLGLIRNVRKCLRGIKSKSRKLTSLGATGTLGCGAALVWVTARCLEAFIKWNGFWNMLGYYRGDCFSSPLLLMRQRELYTNILFIAFIVALGLFLGSEIVFREKEGLL